MNRKLIQTIIIIGSWYHVSMGSLFQDDLDIQNLFVTAEKTRVIFGHTLEDRLSPEMVQQQDPVILHNRRQQAIREASERGILMYQAYQKKPNPEKLEGLRSYLVTRRKLMDIGGCSSKH